MTGSRRAKWTALLSVAALAIGSATIGVTYGAFAGATDEALNVISASPDFRGPTITQTVIGNGSTGTATGFIHTLGTYRVYANVTDSGAPPSGTATVVANVSNVTSGSVAVPLVAGTYSAGGASYNWRSAALTAGTLSPGNLTFSLTATDVAANITTANGAVTVDNTAPAPTNISASGGIAGKPEVGDVLTLTTNDTLDSFALLANWTGAASTVQVRFVNQGGGDRLQVWDAAGTTQVPFGTINLGRTDFTTGTLAFNGSTMTQANGVITIALGAPVVGAVTTVAGTGTMTWTPSATATDRAGNAIATSAFSEPAPVDTDF